MTRREYLESIMPTRKMVDHFVAPAKANVPVELAKIMCNNAQSAFDPEIGWVVCDGFRGGGVGDSRGFYAYEKDGARQVVNYADRPCRIHTYGNSFTHCDQVSNGETWQEYLAAHLLEPEKAEAFTKANGKKLLIILSFGSHNVANALKGEPLFDQTFLDWLATKDVPTIDLRDAFREEYATYRGDVQTFLTPYYIGHHTPRGNFFFAWAIKDRIVEWLDPKPLPYQIASD